MVPRRPRPGPSARQIAWELQGEPVLTAGVAVVRDAGRHGVGLRGQPQRRALRRDPGISDRAGIGNDQGRHRDLVAATEPPYRRLVTSVTMPAPTMSLMHDLRGRLLQCSLRRLG